MLGAYPVVHATGLNMLENETCTMLKTCCRIPVSSVLTRLNSGISDLLISAEFIIIDITIPFIVIFTVNGLAVKHCM